MTQVQPREELIHRRKHSLQPQQVIAKNVGISQALYSQIELGYANPRPDVARQLIEMFNLPPDYFDTNEEVS